MFCQNRGFTLVEMLATILIIALVLPTTMRCIALVTRMASQSNRWIVATTLAETKISELIASDEWKGGGLNRGDFGNDYTDYVWRLDVKNWEISPMSTLSVSVYWDAGEYDENKCVTLTTLVYDKEE
ncbi:MAG: type II secretion system GspH family protein [Phycisphaerae bacterium]|nr:type II secretion system GspH family protein [Phycisphaerae bacterium]